GQHIQDFAAILPKARALMKILTLFILFDAIGIVCGDALRGAGDTYFQMAASLCCAWLLFVPGTYYFTQIHKTDVASAWSCAVAYVLTLAIVLWLRLRSNKWREIKLLER
ncbi:MAG TPA: MATE family efflux transporter, partial [Elusimicrobiales bacterium]|nr:MATE family efflux transporter [Elusimicrobiales bacterium]